MAHSQAFQATTIQLRSEAGPRRDGILRIRVSVIDVSPGQDNHQCRNDHTYGLTARHPPPCIAGAKTAKSPVNCRDNML